MKVIRVRELKAHLSEVLKAVEAGEVIEVTKHGRSVAQIVPIERSPSPRKLSPEEIKEALESMDQLPAEISKYATPGLTAEQIVNEIRS